MLFQRFVQTVLLFHKMFSILNVNGNFIHLILKAMNKITTGLFAIFSISVAYFV